MRKTAIIVATIALTASLGAAAQSGKGSSYRYRWHDAQGLVHYSDGLTAEAMKYGYDVVNDQGLTVSHVDRQLTAQERAVANQKAAAAAAQKRQQQEQANADQQMLAAYPDEADFVAKQKDELATIDQQISTTRANLRSQEKALTDLLDRAGDLERAKQPVPKFLNDRIAEQRNTVAEQRAALDRQLATYVTAELKNEQELKRYRDLKAQTKSDNGSASTP